MMIDRVKLLRLVHVARRELAIDDDAWQSLLQSKFRRTSSKDLSATELYSLVEHLKKCGFKVRHTNKGDGGKATEGRALSRPLAGAAQEFPGEDAKIRALWLFLHHDLGLVKDPNEAALAAYVKRMTGVDALQWLDRRQTLRVIEALKKWAERVFAERLQDRYCALAARMRIPDRITTRYSEVVHSRARAYDKLLVIWQELGELANPKAKGAA